MAELKTDRDLLREYAEGGSEGPFQLLVERHVDLVFAAVMRGVNDMETARELTQNVFITLARKAAWLRGETSVAGWLHKAALFEARGWWRAELRRQRREQAAVELGTVLKDQDSLLKSLAGELDDGLLELRQADRQALMLRYFEGRSHREIGAMLGAREDAVRMRVDKAVARLTQFFRRRGYAVPAVATTLAVLGASAKAAPAGMGLIAARSALTAAGSGSATGAQLLIAKFMGLTKTEMSLLCIALAVAPIAWELNANRISQQRSTQVQVDTEKTAAQQADSSAELERLQAESTRLEAVLGAALTNQARYAAALRKIDGLKTRVRGLLSDPNYRWPDDSPYVRVPKALVKSLDLLHRPPMAFKPSGDLTAPALELFGLVPQEKAPVEQALADYWRGVESLMTANAYETNLPPTDHPARFSKTVFVPPLGQPMTTLAESTRDRLSAVLGEEREQLLFGDWAEGGIQLFSPGNLWKIAEVPQTLSVWVNPAEDGGKPEYGASRHSTLGGMSGPGPWAMDVLPNTIKERFFDPWLAQYGITNSPPNE